MFGMYPIVELDPFYSFPYQDYHKITNAPINKNTPYNQILFEMFEDDIFNSVFEIEPRLQTPKGSKLHGQKGFYMNGEKQDDSQASSNNSSQIKSPGSEDKLHSSSKKESSETENDETIQKLQEEQKNRKRILKDQSIKLQSKIRGQQTTDYCYPLLEVNESQEQGNNEKDRILEEKRRERKSSRTFNSLSVITSDDLSDEEVESNKKENKKESNLMSKNEDKNQIFNERFYTQTQSIRTYNNKNEDKIVLQRIEQNKNGDKSAFVQKKIYDKNNKMIYNQKWREDSEGKIEKQDNNEVENITKKSSSSNNNKNHMQKQDNINNQKLIQ